MPIRRAIPIGDRATAVAHLDALIAEAEKIRERERALVDRRKWARRPRFVPEGGLLVAEAQLAHLRARRTALVDAP